MFIDNILLMFYLWGIICTAITRVNDLQAVNIALFKRPVVVDVQLLASNTALECDASIVPKSHSPTSHQFLIVGTFI